MVYDSFTHLNSRMSWLALIKIFCPQLLLSTLCLYIVSLFPPECKRHERQENMSILLIVGTLISCTHLTLDRISCNTTERVKLVVHMCLLELYIIKTCIQLEAGPTSGSMSTDATFYMVFFFLHPGTWTHRRASFDRAYGEHSAIEEGTSVL